MQYPRTIEFDFSQVSMIDCIFFSINAQFLPQSPTLAPKRSAFDIDDQCIHLGNENNFNRNIRLTSQIIQYATTMLQESTINIYLFIFV